MNKYTKLISICLLLSCAGLKAMDKPEATINGRKFSCLGWHHVFNEKKIDKCPICTQTTISSAAQEMLRKAEEAQLAKQKTDQEAILKAQEEVRVKEQVKNDALQQMLQKAIMADSAEGIKEAARLGANVNQESNGSSVSLALALTLKKNNAIEALIDAGAKVKVDHVNRALNINDFQIALLLVKKAIINVNSAEDAVIGNSIAESAAIRLISRECGPTLAEDTKAVIKELIRKGYSLNSETLNSAIWSGRGGIHSADDIDGFDFLFKNGLNPNQKVNSTNNEFTFTTPLFVAIEYGNLKIIKLLLAAGANISMKAHAAQRHSSIKGEHTPLSYAIAKGNPKVIQFLLEHGATL